MKRSPPPWWGQVGGVQPVPAPLRVPTREHRSAQAEGHQDHGLLDADEGGQVHGMGAVRPRNIHPRLSPGWRSSVILKFGNVRNIRKFV